MLTIEKLFRFCLSILPFLSLTLVQAQQVTGVWKGKIDKKNVEVKIVQNGDSLTGTSYYYESSTNYKRYSIRGYFDQNTNSAVWWDDQLIENKGALLSGRGKTPLLSVADFNCPGGTEMYLDGKASSIENPDDIKGTVALAKTGEPYFPDEWDFVVDNYTVGTNDPDIIDSVFMIAFSPTRRPAERYVFIEEAEPKPLLPKPDMAVIPMPDTKTVSPNINALSIQEKFTSRKKRITAEIPVEGDSVELRFYDNAQIDGDSISLFLNDQLIFTHIRLSDKPYTIKISVTDLQDDNELTMVAENLGTIPPNTAFMVALVGDKRYEAKLASSEYSSAMIRLKKQ